MLSSRPASSGSLPRPFRFLIPGAAALLALALQTATAVPARADDSYPSRPVRVVIPFPAGGPTDIVGRVVTTRMAKPFGQPLVIENRGGAGGSVGTEAVAKAAPDGYTLLLATNSTHGTNPHLYKHLNYHPIDSFTAIAQVGVTPMALAVNQKVPVKTVAEFVSYLKANPGKLNQGTAGVGAGGHIIGALFSKLAGVEFTMVPYAGSGPASQDLMAGVVDFAFDGLPVLAPGIRGGTLRLLATTMKRRALAYPDTPTMAESGYPDIDAYTWNVFFAPAGTPRYVVDRVAREVSAALADPDVIARLKEVGVEPTPDTTPEKTAAFVKREYERWGPLVKLSGAKVE